MSTGSSAHLVKWQYEHARSFKRILYGREDTSAQEIEAGAAVHGAHDQLQTMNVTFNGTIAPVVLKSGLDGSFISAEMFGERGKQAV